jgi:hydrophobe/amphiphile efflux-1 (HAE1) family protein
MSLSDFSIKKPVFAWMLMIGLIVFGILSFLRLGVSQLPDVDFPVVNVSVSWIGASPEVMETAVTDVIEDSIMSIEGVREITSSCQEGLANTTIEFDLNRNIDAAVQEVQTKIAQAQKSLPVGIDPPIVTKSNPEDQPILWVALSGGQDLREKVLFIRDRLKDAITTISGVGDVRLGGYVEPNLRIWLNTDEMSHRQLSVDDVIYGIQSGHTLTPSGYLNDERLETQIKILGEAKTPDQFRGIVLPSRAGMPIWSIIRLGDVAKIEEGLADIRRISRLNGVSSVGLGIVKQRKSNAVAVGKEVKKQLVQISNLLPQGMKLQGVIDSTQFIENSTRELIFTLTLSAILTSLVCWLFLGTWSASLNVILAIPTSLIGSFIALYFFGFTLNTFTLLALSLSIGIVVDDAIMVMENISRYYESGMSRVKASLLGAREITGAAVAASLAVLAIFVPVVFMKGIIGRFFFQFGITMSVTILISLLEALTLAPMRCSQFLTHGKDSWIRSQVDRSMDLLLQWYRRTLEICLKNRMKVLVFSGLGFLLSLLLFKDMIKEFVPPQDQNRFMVSIQTPMGSSLEFTDEVFKQVEKTIRERPEVQAVYSIVGGFQGGLVNQGNLFVTLKEPKNRPIAAPFDHHPSQQELMKILRAPLQKISGVKRVTLLDLSTSGLTTQRGFPVQFSVQGGEWPVLAKLSQKIMKKMSDSGLYSDIDTNYLPNMPEIQITPDRLKAAEKGLSVSSIANAVSSLVGSLRVGKYTDTSGHRDDVRIKLMDQFNKTPEDISKILVRNNRGELIPLSSVVEMKQESSLLTLNRHNRERSISIYANVATGKSQSDALAYIETLGKNELPLGYHITLSGSSQSFQESFQGLILALVLGIFVAYMVLGAQFNSFLHPLTILLALPFSVTGAALALKLTQTSLNLYSMIGFLLLMGIVKKNSILLVDFTLAKRSEGLSIHESLLSACPLRLRPILMTSFASIAAAIPAALSIGPGAETMRSMAIVIIGGVFFSTVLTLIVIPCAYSLLSRFENTQHQDDLRQVQQELSLLSNP